MGTAAWPVADVHCGIVRPYMPGRTAANHAEVPHEKIKTKTKRTKTVCFGDSDHHLEVPEAVPLVEAATRSVPRLAPLAAAPNVREGQHPPPLQHARVAWVIVNGQRHAVRAIAAASMYSSGTRGARDAGQGDEGGYLTCWHASVARPLTTHPGGGGGLIAF